jgi:hypothetical protein
MDSRKLKPTSYYHKYICESCNYFTNYKNSYNKHIKSAKHLSFHPKEEVQGFILDASSSFYAEFGLLVRQRVDQWLDQKRADLNSDDLIEGENDDE